MSKSSIYLTIAGVLFLVTIALYSSSHSPIILVLAFAALFLVMLSQNERRKEHGDKREDQAAIRDIMRRAEQERLEKEKNKQNQK